MARLIDDLRLVGLPEWARADEVITKSTDVRSGSNAVNYYSICAQDPAQLGFAQDHDMIQAVSPDRADEPFDVSVLPGRSRCRWSVADTHGREASGCWMAVRGISITDEVSRRLLPGKGLGDLSGDPVGRRVGGDVDPHRLASLKPDNHQAVEQLEADRRHDKQIDGAHDRAYMISLMRRAVMEPGKFAD